MALELVIRSQAEQTDSAQALLHAVAALRHAFPQMSEQTAFELVWSVWPTRH